MLEESVIIDSGFVVSKFLNVLRSQFFAINCWRDGKQAIGMRMSCNKNIRTRVEQIPLEATRWRVVARYLIVFTILLSVTMIVHFFEYVDFVLYFGR